MPADPPTDPVWLTFRIFEPVSDVASETIWVWDEDDSNDFYQLNRRRG